MEPVVTLGAPMYICTYALKPAHWSVGFRMPVINWSLLRMMRANPGFVRAYRFVKGCGISDCSKFRIG